MVNENHLSLKGAFSSGSALARPGGLSSTSLAGRFNSGQSSDPEALSRLRQDRSAHLKSQTSLAVAREEEVAAERERKANEALFQRKIEEVQREMTVALAVVLDFTASTTHDIKCFKGNVRELRGRLSGKLAALKFLPVAVQGGMGESPNILVGAVDNMQFFEDVSNIAYTWDSPMGPGIKEVVDSGFLRGDSTIQAICYFSDNFFEEGARFREKCLPFLQEKKVAVAGLVSNPAAQDHFMRQSHTTAIVEPLGERGIVVFRDSTDMEPVEVVAEFLLNLAENQAKPIAQSRMPQMTSVAPQLVQPVRFDEFLRLQGKTGVGRIAQGATHRLLNA